MRAKGLKFGGYYSQSQDWVNLGGGKGNTAPWDEEQRKECSTNISPRSHCRKSANHGEFHPDILWWDTEY